MSSKAVKSFAQLIVDIVKIHRDSWNPVLDIYSISLSDAATKVCVGDNAGYLPFMTNIVMSDHVVEILAQANEMIENELVRYYSGEIISNSDKAICVMSIGYVMYLHRIDLTIALLPSHASQRVEYMMQSGINGEKADYLVSETISKSILSSYEHGS